MDIILFTVPGPQVPSWQATGKQLPSPAQGISLRFLLPGKNNSGHKPKS